MDIRNNSKGVLMTRINKEHLFVTRLARQHRAEMGKEETRQLETVFGPGSIRFKLDSRGAGKLFKSLGGDIRDNATPGENSSTAVKPTVGRND